MRRRSRPESADLAAPSAPCDHFDSPEPDLDFGIVLGLAYQSIVDHLNAQLAERGFADIRPAFGYVFRALAEQPLTSSQLARRLGITAQGAGKLVDQMVKAAYVERCADRHDRRTKWLSLTSRGLAALAAAHRIHHDIEQRLAAEVGAADVVKLRQLLLHIGAIGEPSPSDTRRTLRLT